jgi:23S rRNA (uridine2552-2'-O)-methyltransferase
LDLGCSPGSWLLYAAKIVGKRGRVIGFDINPVTVSLPPQVTVHTGDVHDLEAGVIEAVRGNVDAVLSDMAPATTGNKNVDAARSLNLCVAALDIAERCLKPGGIFVCKIFQGEDFNAFSLKIKRAFQKKINFKPRSSRKASREIYVIGTGKRDEEAKCQGTANGPV